MIDLTQTLLVIVIVVLTTLLSVIGVQLILILKEFRHTLVRVNQVLDQLESTLHHLSNPISGVGGLIQGLKQGAKLVDSLGSWFKRNNPSPPSEISPMHES